MTTGTFGFVPWTRSISMLILFGALALSACTSDGSETSTDAASVSSTDEPAICEPFLEVNSAFTGQLDPAATAALLDDVEANAPDAISGELGVLTAAARTVLDTGDFSAFETAEFGTAIVSAETWIFNNCDFVTNARLIATEYRYDGQQAEYPAGRTVLTLVNEGMEAHELQLLRRNADVTISLDEMLELPESEARALTTSVGSAFVGPPGASSNLIVELVPGEYIAICTIRAGTVVAEDGTITEGDGEPHLMLGMSFEFGVS